jgi:hypothetical protein
MASTPPTIEPRPEAVLPTFLVGGNSCPVLSSHLAACWRYPVLFSNKTLSKKHLGAQIHPKSDKFLTMHVTT